MSMQITLSTDSAVENWGKNAVLSFNNDGAVIHFSAKKDRTLVQKAARKVVGRFIKGFIRQNRIIPLNFPN